jgi:dipeptidyl-peptidase 4
MTGPHPDFLRTFAETRGFSLGRPTRIQITPAGDAVLFLRSPPRAPDHDLYELQVATGGVRRLARPSDLLGGLEEEISVEERARRERLRIADRGFTWYALSPDGADVLLPASGRLFLLGRQDGRVRALTPAGASVMDPRFSPDGRRIAFVRSGDIYVLELEIADPEAVPRRITPGATEDVRYGLAEFVAQEEMGRYEGYWWSPDGVWLAFAEIDESGVERFGIADPARPEQPPVRVPYPRAGRNNARVRLGIVPAESVMGPPPAPVWVDWDRERYPYLCRVLWDSERAPLGLLVQSRDQREVALLAVDSVEGGTRTLVSERDEAWINLDRDLPRWLPNGSGLLWASERSGRRALELRDPEGAFVREICPADRGFISLGHVTPDSSAIFVLEGGPVGNAVTRIELPSGRRQVLTDDAAEHAPLFASAGRLWVDSLTDPGDLPRSVVVTMERGEVTRVPDVAEPPPFEVQLELMEPGEEPGFHAALIRPRAFDRARRYPVVLHVYGGPHSLMVRADRRHYLYDQWLADHGCIVVAIDNRGTPRRGRAWERAIKGRFGEVPLADQVAGLQALGRRFAELDLERVGVYGWSFGGYLAALALLRRPDLFKVAVAGAPVVDWHDYDTHYTERYLDLPQQDPEAYRTGSLLSYAGQLRRPLLIVHGTADDNVYFFHSLKLADALVRAGRRFDFLPLPGVTHQISDAIVREKVWARVSQFLLAGLGLTPQEGDAELERGSGAFQKHA